MVWYGVAWYGLVNAMVMVRVVVMVVGGMEWHRLVTILAMISVVVVVVLVMV